MAENSNKEKVRGYTVEVVPAKPQAPSSGSSGVAIEGLAPEADAKDKLLIDGKEVPYLKSEEGYWITYSLPAPTLMDAARDYLATQKNKEDGE